MSLRMKWDQSCIYSVWCSWRWHHENGFVYPSAVYNRVFSTVSTICTTIICATLVRRAIFPFDELTAPNLHETRRSSEPPVCCRRWPSYMESVGDQMAQDLRLRQMFVGMFIWVFQTLPRLGCSILIGCFDMIFIEPPIWVRTGEYFEDTLTCGC